MKGDKTAKGQDVIPTSSGAGALLPARGLLHALSEIQLVSEGEKRAGDYNPEILITLNVRFSFMWEGFYASLIPLLFTFFTLPISIAVFKNWLPAFGQYEHGLFDKFLIFMLSFSPGMLKVLFVAFIISRCFLGECTKTLVHYFVIYSIIPTVLSITLIGFFVYNIIYVYLFTSESIIYLAENIGKLFKSAKATLTTFSVLYYIRKSIPLASFTYLFYGITEVAILLIAYATAWYNTKKYKETLIYWDLRKE